MNDEGLEIFYQPSAHSSADSFVLFRSSDVIVTGDVMDTTRFPVIDLANGGSIQGEIDALNRLIDLTIAPTPFIYKDPGTYVVPGHGRVCEQNEVVDYRDMVVLVRDVVADSRSKARTLDQIKAARPALPYETRYGTRPASPTAFVEANLQEPAGEKVMKKAVTAITFVLAAMLGGAGRLRAGRGGRGGPPAPPQTPKAAAAHRRHRLLGLRRHEDCATEWSRRQRATTRACR